LPKRLALFACIAAVLLLGPIAQAAVTDWDVKSDTWTATDTLGRTLPGYAQCGPVKKDKTIGIFYFIWQGQHGVVGPYDISKITAG